MEDGVVADCPWCDAGDGKDAGKRGAKKHGEQRGLGFEGAEEHPQAADWKKQEECGVEQDE